MAEQRMQMKTEKAATMDTNKAQKGSGKDRKHIKSSSPTRDNPGSAMGPATAMEFKAVLTPSMELDAAEHELLRKSERAILETFDWGSLLDTGKALKVIRDKKLYRAKAPTFKVYCREDQGIEYHYALRLIGAATCYDGLMEHLDFEEYTLPKDELQIRPLVALDPKEAAEAWRQISANTKGRPITIDDITAVAQKPAAAARTSSTAAMSEVGALAAEALDELQKLNLHQLKQALVRIQAVVDRQEQA